MARQVWFWPANGQPNTYFYDLNAKLTYKPGTKDVLSLSFYNGQDDLDNSRNSDQNSFGRPFGGSGNLAFNQQNTDLTNWETGAPVLNGQEME